MAQWLGGETSIREGSAEEWTFDSSFVLVSKAFGRHRVSLRADRFDTSHVETTGTYPFQESGKAWTVGWSFEPSRHWSFALEALRIESESEIREVYGLPEDATERQLQLQVRYTK